MDFPKVDGQTEFKVFAWGLGVFGFGDSILEALENAKKYGGSDKYAIYLVTDDFQFNGENLRATIVRKVAMFDRKFKLIKEE